MAIGFYVEGQEMICESCSFNPMYNLVLTDVDMKVILTDLHVQIVGTQ